MTNSNGTPIWYELMTSDTDGAQAFYADVIGWTIAPTDMAAAADYRILTAPDGQDVGGLLPLPAGTPMQPGWLAYIGVEDVDAVTERVVELGGSIHMPPQDIPGVGRFALVCDPQGLAFYIMRGNSPDASQAFHVTAPGHCGWNELVTSDHNAALAFYGALFGWQSNEAMPMGELGDYCFIDHDDQRIGATMTAVADWPLRWTCYFNVPSIDAAIARIASGGGTVTMGPQEVPGGMHILLGTDPQGAAFAVVGER